MNQSQFLAITCNSLEAREKSRVQGAICFGFDSHWLKNWRESFKPITKRSNRSHVITFDSHLKTALLVRCCVQCWLIENLRRRQLRRNRHIKIELSVKLNLLGLFHVDHVVQNKRTAVSLAWYTWFSCKGKD